MYQYTRNISSENLNRDSDYDFLKDDRIINKIKKIEEDYHFIEDCCRFLLQKINNIETQNEQILKMLEQTADAPIIEIMNDPSNNKIDQNLKTQIVDYYKENGTLYPSEVAEALNIELKEVVSIVKELIKDKELEVA